MICSNLSLSALPTFDAQEDPFGQYPSGGGFYSRKFIYLDENNISEIPERAFANLGKFYPGGNLSIDLSFNKISNIDINALEGLENNTISLLLHRNMLTFIPKELVNSQNILNLDLTMNPLKMLSTDFITVLAPTLQRFYLSVNQFTEMPKEMGFLQAVAIGIDGLHETELKATIQDNGYTTELKELFISNSTLEDVSIIPCRFPGLLHLHLEDNYNLNANPFNNCGVRGNLSLNTLEIENCNMTAVDVSIYQSVRYLSLRNNLLESVPDSIVELQQVWMVDLANNLISEIGDDDFEGLDILADLILDNNPLTSISDSAFVTNDIRYLSLRGTLLSTIPVAIARSPRLYSLSLPDNSIDCTCSSLTPVKGLTLSYSHTTCKNDPEKRIYDYLRDELPLCSGEN